VKLDRLNRGEAVALVSALALFVLMFFSWYGSELSEQAKTLPFPTDSGGSAWQTLGAISFVLTLTAAVTVGMALLRLRDSKWDPVIPLNAVVAVLGCLSFLLIGFRIVDPPGLGALGGVAVEATRDLGVFLGFIAAAGIAYGGYRAIGERGTSFAKIADSLQQPEHRSREGRGREG
jgi:amino acid transporter